MLCNGFSWEPSLVFPCSAHVLGYQPEVEAEAVCVDRPEFSGYHSVSSDAHGNVLEQSGWCGLEGLFGIGLPNISSAGLGRVASSGVALMLSRARLVSPLDFRHFLMMGLMYRIWRSMNPFDCGCFRAAGGVLYAPFIAELIIL